MRVALPILLLVGVASASPDRPWARLEAELPPGWSLLATETELVLRHDKPCYATEAVATSGPMVMLELRYRLEPKWTAKQLADAKATNDRIAADIAQARTRYQVDKIRVANGKLQPKTADERRRVAAFLAAEHAALARQIATPLCSPGDASLFDDGAYAQLGMKLDPPEAVAEARRVVELVKKECGAAK